MNPQGYGFVKTAQGEYFIPKRKTGGAFDGDTVEIAETKREASRGHRERREEQRRGKKQEARVVNIVERAHGSIIGRYEVAEPFGIVVPLDRGSAMTSSPSALLLPISLRGASCA